MLRLIGTVLVLICAGGFALAQSRGAVVLQPADADAPVALYSRSHALVIGIDGYDNGWPRLANAVRDARDVAEALAAQGFEVTFRTDLGADALEESIEDFVYDRGQDPESRLLIWFAGHGHMVGEEAYLVPADAPGPEQDRLFRRRALSMRDFGKFMREVRSKHVLAIFDSCFSGNVFQSTRAAVSPAITRATTLPVRQIISSGDAGQVVSDDGTFRKLFLAALAGDEPNADANRDGYITGSELGLFLGDKVTSLTDSRQTPRFGMLRELGFDRGDFVFQVAPRRGAAVPPEPVAVVPPGVLAPPEPAPPEPAPPADAALDLSGNETVLLMDGRLALTMVRTPTGGRRDLVAVTANGERRSLGIGQFVAASDGGRGCTVTLTEIVTGQNRARFLVRCGVELSRDDLRSARIAVEVGAAPGVARTMTIRGGTSQVLEPTATVLSVLGTPYGARSDLVGVTIRGKRQGLGVGDVRSLEEGGRKCQLTVTRIHAGENKADFLLRCD